MLKHAAVVDLSIDSSDEPLEDSWRSNLTDFHWTILHQFGLVASSLAALVDDAASSSSVALRRENERSVVGEVCVVYLITRSK